MRVVQVFVKDVNETENIAKGLLKFCLKRRFLGIIAKFHS